MKRPAAFLPVLLLLPLLLAAPARADFEAGVRGMYWFPDLSATAQSFTGGIAETKFDATNDLGVGDEDFPSGEAFLRAGRLTFRVGYTPVRYDGNKTLAREIVFGGDTFSVSDDVITSLDVTMIDGEVQVDLLRPDLGVAGFHLGVIVKVKYVDGELELSSSAMTEKRDFRVPIPMLGAAVGAGFAKNLVRVDARGAGMAYSGHHLYEAEAFASICPFPFLRLQGGYRWIDLKVDDDDIVAELEMKGPYAGVQLSF